MATQYAKDQPQGFTNKIQRVAIVGATGHIGNAIVQELVKAGNHKVTALTRPESTSSLPSGVEGVKVDYTDESAVASALKDHDFLIITLATSAAPGTHSSLVRAAKEAGIKYVMPNVYCPDIGNLELADGILLGPQYRGYIQDVKDAGLHSIILGCGFWYEWSLGCGEGCYGVDFKKRTVTFFDDGNTKINTSTWEQCGRAVAALLSLSVLPEDAGDKSTTLSQYGDKIVYIDSFLISQKDMFDSVKRVTGTTDKDWTIKNEDSQERYKKARELLGQGNRLGFVRAMYTRVFWPNKGGNYTHKGLQNEALKLPKEDLDTQTKESLRLVEDGEIPSFG